MDSLPARDRHVFSIPGGVFAGASARRAIAGLSLPSREHLDADLRLLVSELVNNGVLHGGAGAGATLELAVSLSQNTLRVEVADPGHGFMPRAPFPTRASVPSGRGLLLVDRIADRWGVAAGPRTRVWAELDLPDGVQPLL